MVMFVKSEVNILTIQINIEKEQKTNMIHNLMTIEIMMKKKEPNIFTKNLITANTQKTTKTET